MGTGMGTGEICAWWGGGFIYIGISSFHKQMGSTLPPSSPSYPPLPYFKISTQYFAPIPIHFPPLPSTYFPILLYNRNGEGQSWRGMFIQFNTPNKCFIINTDEIVWIDFNKIERTFKLKMKNGDQFELEGVHNLALILRGLDLHTDSFTLFEVE